MTVWLLVHGETGSGYGVCGCFRSEELAKTALLEKTERLYGDWVIAADGLSAERTCDFVQVIPQEVTIDRVAPELREECARGVVAEYQFRLVEASGLLAQLADKFSRSAKGIENRGDDLE